MILITVPKSNYPFRSSRFPWLNVILNRRRPSFNDGHYLDTASHKCRKWSFPSTLRNLYLVLSVEVHCKNLAKPKSIDSNSKCRQKPLTSRLRSARSPKARTTPIRAWWKNPISWINSIWMNPCLTKQVSASTINSHHSSNHYHKTHVKYRRSL